jgi:thiosulfate/3-mercaptopyruvate sulfurtransferase
MMRNRLALVLSVGLLLSGCVTPPTKTYQKNEAKTQTSDTQLRLSDQTVLTDARLPFEYAVSHVNGSYNMLWTDFTHREEWRRGVLEGDLFFHARRLARLGLDPKTPIVVIGKGLQGQGDEGRLAWTLMVLGFSDVQLSHIDSLNRTWTKDEAPALEPKAVWKPEVQENLWIERKDFLAQAMTAEIKRPNVKIFDVRSVDEYLGKLQTLPHGKMAPDLGAINIPWTEFFERDNRLRTEIQDQLSAIGITKDHEILVISNQGVRSGAVTFALQKMGYKKARNFMGGYRELLRGR